MVLFPAVKFILSNSNTLVIKLSKVAIMNWVCNNVTTIYIYLLGRAVTNVGRTRGPTLLLVYVKAIKYV